MKKFLIALMFLMSTLSFAGTINYYNQSEDTVQFLRDGNSPGPGSSVIPGGYYSEHMPNGNYHLSATNGQETTSGYDCTLSVDNDRCDYKVYTQQSYAAPNGMKYVTVSQKPTVTDWVLIPGGPFTRSGMAPYNMYYSPTTIIRDGSDVAVATEAIPTDGTPIRYTVMGIDCTLNEFRYETYDTSTDTWSDLSELKDIPPNTAVSHLEPLICQ